MSFEIWTDGGCRGNPGPGGWAYLFVENEKIVSENYGAEKHTTNNRMELSAVIAALGALTELVPEITVHTDSEYVQKGISEWIKGWKAKNWRTSGKKPVKNEDLWRKLDGLSAPLNIKWRWVKGHSGNVFNERCDKLVQCAINRLFLINHENA